MPQLSLFYHPKKMGMSAILEEEQQKLQGMPISSEEFEEKSVEFWLCQKKLEWVPGN